MNPLRPLNAILKDIKKETADVNTYTLQVGDDYPKILVPGQFNMIGYPGIGEAPISFSAARRDGEIGHTVRGVGMATRFIQTMTKGAEVQIRGPYGRGWPMERIRNKNIVLIAGGIGLAPIRPVIEHILSNRTEFGTISVLYGARNEQNLLFTDEYPEWQKAVMLYVTVDEFVKPPDRNYAVGLITSLLDKVNLTEDNAIALVCGPEMMMRFICRGLRLRNMPASNIYVSLERRMKCGIAQCGHCQHVGLFVCKDGPVFSYDQVAGLMDGML